MMYAEQRRRFEKYVYSSGDNVSTPVKHGGD
jgi:hypothetical protein